jgi:hypothetical protein
MPSAASFLELHSMISRSFRRGFRCRSLSSRSFPRADSGVGLLRDGLGKEENLLPSVSDSRDGKSSESVFPQLSFEVNWQMQEFSFHHSSVLMLNDKGRYHSRSRGYP